MALSVTSTPIPIKSAGGFRFQIVKFVGDAAIPAAGTGYTVLASTLNLNGIKAVITQPDTTGVYFTTGTPNASGSQAALRFFVAATAVEAALNEAGVNNKIVYALVIGW